MIKISCLSDLKPGETAFICGISDSGIRCRLIDLGLAKGTAVECVTKAPMGGPGAYLIRGSVIALRRADALTVNIQRTPSKSPIRTGGKPLWD